MKGEILNPRRPDLANAQGSYLTLGAFTTLEHWRNAAIITALCTVAGLGFLGYTSVTETRKRQIYQKALNEVEKMK